MNIVKCLYIVLVHCAEWVCLHRYQTRVAGKRAGWHPGLSHTGWEAGREHGGVSGGQAAVMSRRQTEQSQANRRAIQTEAPDPTWTPLLHPAACSVCINVLKELASLGLFVFFWFLFFLLSLPRH